ncbi:MAG TPA: hypothetical protein VGC42_16400, partial [Kofleriaceae bacterium]
PEPEARRAVEKDSSARDTGDDANDANQGQGVATDQVQALAHQAEASGLRVSGSDVSEPRAVVTAAAAPAELTDRSDPDTDKSVRKTRSLALPGVTLPTQLAVGTGTRAAIATPGLLGAPVPLRYIQATDLAFDDLTGFIPALFADAADAWRARLASPGPHAIDPAAARLLTAARAALPAGVYHWNGSELAVDAAHHFAWRRTTEAGLAETAVFDGASWRRRYPELGLEVARPVAGHDALALGLGYFPLWIGEPADYAAAYDVALRGAHEVVLSRRDHGVELVLAFDDQARLVSVTGAGGEALVEVTWTGGLTVKLGGEPIAAGYSPQPVADAAQWASGADALVTIDLPLRPVAYWDGELAASRGDHAHAVRQRIASLVALGNAAAAWPAYRELQPLGALGDLVLASSGFAVTPLAQLGALADAPVGRYLQAGREFPARQISAPPASLAPSFVRGLWHLRAAVAESAANRGKAAVEQVLAIGERAPELQLIGASVVAGNWALGADAAQVWDGVATGAYRNVARAAAIRALFQRGLSEQAATRIAALIDDLDLSAAPPRLDGLAYAVLATRRGAAGWQLVWSAWRDRVQTAGSYDHIMALIAATYTDAQQLDPLLDPLLDRAAVLAGNDAARLVAVAREATRFGRGAWAEAHLRPLAKAHPSQALYQLLATLALSQNRHADALADLEAAQAAAGDAPAGLAQLRAEYRQLIAVAHKVAVDATGPARQAAVGRALAWGARWRAIDPANPELDRHLGELWLAVGDPAAAWRQLSTVIERDPWSGAGYELVADTLEHQGKVADSLEYWQLAIVIDQTDPTPRLRKAQALIALGKPADGDALLREIVHRTWHPNWEGVVYQARELLAGSQR